MAVYQSYLRDRASKLLILVIIALVVQVVFTAYVRPRAEEWRAEQRAIAARTPGYSPQRSIWIIIRDPEQEATIIVAIASVRAVGSFGTAAGCQRREVGGPPGFDDLRQSIRHRRRP